MSWTETLPHWTDFSSSGLPGPGSSKHIYFQVKPVPNAILDSSEQCQSTHNFFTMTESESSHFCCQSDIKSLPNEIFACLSRESNIRVEFLWGTEAKLQPTSKNNRLRILWFIVDRVVLAMGIPVTNYNLALLNFSTLP